MISLQSFIVRCPLLLLLAAKLYRNQCSSLKGAKTVFQQSYNSFKSSIYLVIQGRMALHFDKQRFYIFMKMTEIRTSLVGMLRCKPICYYMFNLCNLLWRIGIPPFMLGLTTGYTTSTQQSFGGIDVLPMIRGMIDLHSFRPISLISFLKLYRNLSHIQSSKGFSWKLTLLNLLGVKSYTSYQLLFHGLVLVYFICYQSSSYANSGKQLIVISWLLQMIGWLSQKIEKLQLTLSLTLNCWVVQTTLRNRQSRMKTLDSQAPMKMLQYLHSSTQTQAEESNKKMLHYSQSDI